MQGCIKTVYMRKGNVRKMNRQTKYLVTTASGTEERPTENAVKEKYTEVSILWHSSLEKVKQYGNISWLEKGSNHRVIEVKGRPHVARDLEVEGWFVELETLDDLGAFIDEVRDAVVIERRDSLSGDMAIIIYDDYMD